MTGFWDDAEVIHSYTREQALADGVLVDVSDSSEAKEAGFLWPVALTSALWHLVEPTTEEEGEGQSVAGRLWDVLYLARLAIKRSSGGTSLRFDCAFVESGRGGRRRTATHVIHLETGPGDDGEPVVTVGFPLDF